MFVNSHIQHNNYKSVNVLNELFSSLLWPRQTDIFAKNCPSGGCFFFHKKVHLCLDPLCNVVRHLKEQSEPVGGENKHFNWPFFEGAQLPPRG